MKLNEIINESRLGSIMSLREIPERYKKYKVIGRGTTTIALDYSPDVALVLTKDPLKKDWLMFGLGIVEWIETFESKKHHNMNVRDYPVYVLKMEKLYKLDSNNRHIVRKMIKEYDKAVDMNRKGNSIDWPALLDYYEEHDDDHQIKQFLSHIVNYDERQFQHEVQIRQFLQNKDGSKIILVDPVVDRQLIQDFMDWIR